jgi:hypothetical protein
MSGTLNLRKRRGVGSGQHCSAPAGADEIDAAKMLKARETQRFLIALAQLVKALASGCGFWRAVKATRDEVISYVKDLQR